MTPIVTNHPLIQHKLTHLRQTETSSKDFRQLISEIATLLCYEATRDLALEEVEITTPMTKTMSKVDRTTVLQGKSGGTGVGRGV